MFTPLQAGREDVGGEGRRGNIFANADWRGGAIIGVPVADFDGDPPPPSQVDCECDLSKCMLCNELGELSVSGALMDGVDM